MNAKNEQAALESPPMHQRGTAGPARLHEVASPLRWAWLLMLLVWPVFAHGCHSGDHDDELSLPRDLAPKMATETDQP